MHNFSKEQPKDQSTKLEVISSWESFVRNHVCYLEEREVKEGKPSQCLIDWNNWLEIGKNSIKGSFFIAQYFLLMTACFADYFTNSDNQGIEELKILPEPVYGDENDFTGRWGPAKRNESNVSDVSSQQNAVEQPEQSFSE